MRGSRAVVERYAQYKELSADPVAVFRLMREMAERHHIIEDELLSRLSRTNFKIEENHA